MFPTWETLGAQVVAFAFVIGSYFAAEYVRIKRPRARAAAASATRRASRSSPALPSDGTSPFAPLRLTKRRYGPGGSTAGDDGTATVSRRPLRAAILSSTLRWSASMTCVVDALRTRTALAMAPAPCRAG